MTYSPGLTSGSIVMFDMMLFFLPEVGCRLEAAQNLFTLLTGAEAKSQRNKRALYEKPAPRSLLHPPHGTRISPTPP